MADNVAITAGSGTTIATDDISTVHYQRVKLVDGTLDSTTAIAAGGGVESGALRVTLANDSTGLVSIDDNGGSLTVDGTITANAGTGSFTSAGDVAHDGADSGNPVKVGGRAIAHGANPTAVAADDRTNLYANRHGIPFVIGGHMNAIVNGQNFTTSQTDVALVTISTGLKIVVTQIQATCDNANTVSPNIKIGFGTATIPSSGAGVLFWHPGVPPGGGASRGDGAGIVGVGADNEDLRITCGAATGGSLSVVVTYYTIES